MSSIIRRRSGLIVFRLIETSCPKGKVSMVRVSGPVSEAPLRRAGRYDDARRQCRGSGFVHREDEARSSSKTSVTGRTVSVALFLILMDCYQQPRVDHHPVEHAGGLVWTGRADSPSITSEFKP
jgi:hypothetical protein